MCHPRHFLMLLLVLLFCCYPLQTAAWKDEGHMLVAAVARQYMRASTIEKVENLLQLWKSLYPSTSTLESSAVWLDHVQCTSAGTYCSNFPRLDALTIFRTFHYTSNTWNPQNIDMRIIDQALPYPHTGACWAMQEIFHTLLRCTSTSGDITEGARLESANRAINTARQYGKHIVERLQRARGSSEQQKTGGAASATSMSAASGESTAASGESTAASSQKPASERRGTKKGGKKTGTFSKHSFTALRETKSKPAAEFTEMYAEAGLPTLPQGGVCSVVTLSLYLRMLIHIVGDAHQPLHNSEVFSKVFRDGDRGGNKVFVSLPPTGRPSVRFEDPHEGAVSATGGFTQNLHGEWDGLFGAYETYFFKIDMKTLKNNAQRLVHLFPMDDLAVKTFENFPYIVKESFDIARKEVYSEFDWKTFTYKSLPYKPTPKYISKARQIGESRIALAGARLALILESLAPSLPQIAAAAAPPPFASAWQSPVKFPGQPGMPTAAAASETSRGRGSTRDSSRGRSSTRDSSRGRSITRDSSRGRSITRDSSRGRSITRDSSRGRSITRDSSRGHSITRDSSISRGESLNSRDISGRQDSELFLSSEGDQGQQREELELQSASGSTSFVLQRADASLPAFVKEDDNERKDNHSPFADAISTAKEYPSFAAAGALMLVLMLLLMAVQVWLYRKVQLYKQALQALLSRDSATSAYAAAAETKGTPHAVAKLLAEHENGEKKQSMSRCETEDDDASTTYVGDSTASLLHS